MQKSRNFLSFALSLIVFIYISLYSYDFYWLIKIERDYKSTIEEHIPNDVYSQINESTWNYNIENRFNKFIEHYQKKILFSIVEMIFLYFFNVLLYKEKYRDDLFSISKWLVKTFNLDILASNEMLSMYFYFNLFYPFTFIRIYEAFGFTDEYFRNFIGIILNLFINIYLMSKKPFKIRFLNIMIIGISCFIINVGASFIKNTIYFRKFKNIPDFLNKHIIEKTKNNFGENIYYIPEGSFGCHTSYFITHFKLICEGYFGDLSKNMIDGLICHEIGHAHPYIFPSFLLTNFLLKIFAIFAYIKIFTKHSKNIENDKLSQETLTTFVLAINLPIMLISYRMVDMISKQIFEIYADFMSCKLAPDGDLSSCLIMYNFKTHDFIFRPLFYSLLNETHPPTYLRIKLLKYFKSKN